MLQYRFRCPCCLQLYSASLSQRGQRWRCPQTNQTIQLPPRKLLPPARAEELATVHVPDLLLHALTGVGGMRERRLALAAIGRALTSPDDTPGQGLADVVERLGDGLATPSEVNWARARVEEWLSMPTRNYRRAHLANIYDSAIRNVDWYELAPPALAGEPGQSYACDVIRDVYWRWFHTLVIRESWLTANDGAAAKVARAIYDENRFSDLLVLSDALLEAGCDDHALIRHLRGTGPHVRGC